MLVLTSAFAPWPLWVKRTLWILFGAKLLLQIIKSIYWPPVRYKHAAYKVDGYGIEVHEGVLTRITTSVPRSRVQHIDLTHGFLERRLGLATINIHTAARGNSEVSLEGVTLDTATRIRDYLLPQDRSDAV